MPLKDITETFQSDLADPEFARLYLQEALEDSYRMHDTSLFLLALGDVVRARRAVTGAAAQVGVTRPGLYKSLSKGGNPRFATIAQLLPETGFELSIRPQRRVHHVAAKARAKSKAPAVNRTAASSQKRG